MRKSFLTIFLFLPFLAWNEENLQNLSQQAEDLWEARDYTAASNLYEQLLSRSLSNWQRSRLFYNLGTIRLAQHQTNEALELFQKIVPTDLALPRFGRDLFLNQGIAYWQYAQTLASVSNSSLAQQAIFLEQSLKAFSKAQELNCQVQQLEQTESTFYCHSLALIDQWINTVRLQLNTIHTQQRQQWMEQASIEMLASFLQNYVQELSYRLKTFQKQNPKISSEASFLSYFQNQINSFVPVWKALNQKELSSDQKSTFDQAATFYLHAMQALTQQNFSSVLEQLNQTTDALASLAVQENSAVQQAFLSYEILLLQESFNVSDLQKLIGQFDQLKVKESQVQSLESIRGNLQESLKALKSKQVMQTRFFLLAGLNQMESLIKEKQSSPILILQQALKQADRALESFLLAQIMTDEPSKNKQIQTVLNDQQQSTLTHAAFFIPAVLNEQETLFQQAQGPTSRCQQSPWEQVIPLFDQGLQAAQSAKEQLNKNQLNSQNIGAKQKQTIKNWQHALALMQHPPQQNQPSPSNGKSTPQNLTETFRLIQEMYLEDQSQPQPTDQELHSW